MSKPDEKTILFLRELMTIPAPTGTKDVIAGMITALWPEVVLRADPDYWRRPEGGRKWYIEEEVPEPLGVE